MIVPLEKIRQNGRVGVLVDVAPVGDLKPGDVFYTGHDLVTVLEVEKGVRDNYPHDLSLRDVIELLGSTVGAPDRRYLNASPHTRVPVYVVSPEATR